MTNDTLEKVAEAVRLYYRPVTISEIAEASNLSRAVTMNALRALIDNGRIEVIRSENRPYYRIKDANKPKAEADLEEKFAQLDSALNEKIGQISERIQRLEKETAHIYANLISIMGVFVAIFALIVINANAVAGTISQEEKICYALFKLIVLNLPVVACIIALLLGIRLIILRDFKRGDHK